MKKLLVLFLILPLIGMGQCWVIPQCVQTVNLDGPLNNKSYNGSVCFMNTIPHSTLGINNSVNVNNWDYLSFVGGVAVHMPINMNGGKKLYFVDGYSHITHLNMAGGDTIYVLNGELHITNYTSNNAGNVIILGMNARVWINGTYFTERASVSSNNNPHSAINIIPCTDPALPIKFTNFKAKRILGSNKVQIEFHYENAVDIEKFEVMVSLDGGLTERPVLIILPNKGKSGYFSTVITINE